MPNWRRWRPRRGSGWPPGSWKLDLGMDRPRDRQGRWRSPPRGWATCWTPCTGLMTRSGSPGHGGDEVFELVLARIIEPRASRTRCGSWKRRARPRRRIPRCQHLPAGRKSRRGSSCRRPAPCTPGYGPASLVLYDVSTLYFETTRAPSVSLASPRTPAGTADHRGPAHRAAFPSWSALRREQGRDQDDAPGHPPVHGRPPAPRCHRGRRRGHGISEANQEGHRGRRPGVVWTWTKKNKKKKKKKYIYIKKKKPDGHVFVQPWPAGHSSKRRDQMDLLPVPAPTGPGARCAGSDQQVAKAAKAVAGLAPVKRNRSIALNGAVKEPQPAHRGQGQGPRPGSRDTSPTSPSAPTGTPLTSELRHRQLAASYLRT